MCVWVFSLCLCTVYVQHPRGSEEGRILWECSYRRLLAAKQVLGIESWASRGEASALNPFSSPLDSFPNTARLCAIWSVHSASDWYGDGKYRTRCHFPWCLPILVFFQQILIARGSCNPKLICLSRCKTNIHSTSNVVPRLTHAQSSQKFELPDTCITALGGPARLCSGFVSALTL